jgi:hypothetical protein
MNTEKKRMLVLFFSVLKVPFRRRPFPRRYGTCLTVGYWIPS